MTELEKFWEFDCDLIINGKLIRKITITDHFKKKHSEISVNDILLIINMINGRQAEQTSYIGPRKVFKFISFYKYKKYRVIFWFKDNTTDHLWIRNCYRIN